MKPAAFEYHAPRSLADAAAALAELGEGAKILAGGQSLIPMMALRLATFDHLVDVGRVDELSGIERSNGHLWVGAGTTEAAVGASEEVAAAVPLLSRVTPLIGHFQIRNRGTVGGSIAHADPAAEYPAVAIAIDAELEAVSVRGRRTIPAADFFTGLWSTALEPDEILAGIRFPVWSGRCGFGVEEMARRHGDFAIAGAVTAVEVSDEGTITRCGIGLIGMASTPERAASAESRMVGQAASEVDVEEVGRLATADLADIPSDLHGSAAYRRTVQI
jgi:carbon-monoxide dehydrogenase medium subunit